MKEKWVREDVIVRLIGPYFKGHCESCHQDEAMGYDMCFLDLGKGRYAEVCCRVAEAFEEWLQDKKKREAST